jgi:hypothetical protein
MTNVFETQFLYRGEPDSLQHVYDALIANDDVSVRDGQEPSEHKESEIHYDEPFISSIHITDLMGEIPRSESEETGLRLQIYQHKGAFLQEDHDVDAEACRSHVDLTKYLYETLPTQPALVCSTSPVSELRGTPLPGLDENGDIAYPRRFLTWLDIYPPAEVATIGRETLLSAPAPRVEELEDGSVLMAIRHPLDVSMKQLRFVSKHLDIPHWADFEPES